ncbi:MAG TPA: nucleotide disphospho-sugar-binding domain-containing protein [Actinomycetota bacterium]|nr:nucleotide disphospho-sugar-binding domain-containing protein [Actinomycetota bacterium]
MTDPKTIVFFPEGAFGPTNNCVGIGNVLKQRGNRVIFIVEESFAGTLEAKGFEETHMRLGPPPEQEEEPGQFWKDFIRDTAPEFRKPTIVQLETFLKPTWQALIDGAMYVDDRLRDIFDEIRPDVVVEDNVVAFAALPTSGRPWVRITSCNPLEWKDPDIPPVFSGYAAGDRSGWEEFWSEYDRILGPQIAEFSWWLASRGAPPLPDHNRDYIWESPYLNLFVYPAFADYGRREPLPPTAHRLDSSVRATDDPFEVPEQLRDGGGKLVYLSLGSLASADVELMQRLVDVLAKTGHRYIVSKGPQHELFDLADNMYGEEFLPQTTILPQVDLVITHGGNNTVTECFHFGKPTIALPVFWDQYDNAQRVDELGFGKRLATYGFDDEELRSTIDRLAGDEPLHARMAERAAALRANPGTVKAADLIERVAVTQQPAT